MLFCSVGFSQQSGVVRLPNSRYVVPPNRITGVLESRLGRYDHFLTVPLKIAKYIGLAAVTLAVVFGGYVVIATLLFENPVAGYPSLMAVALFLGGMQLITLGLIGEYLGRIYETKSIRTKPRDSCLSS